MKFFQTKAIVIKKTRFSEGDSIVTFFSEQYGKIRFLAKGICFFKNRFHGRLEPASCVSLSYSGRGIRDLLFFSSCESLDTFKGIGEDHKKIFSAFYFLELVDSWFKENDPNPSIYHLLHASLSLLEKMTSYETLIRIFELRLLTITGYSPKLDMCVICGLKPKEKRISFNYEKGGIICSRCVGGRVTGPKISLGALNFAQAGSTIKYQNISRLKIPKKLAGEIETLIHHFLVSRLGRELKSYRFLELE